MTAPAAADAMGPELAAALAADAERVERALEVLLPERAGEEASLFAAMRYATLGGGKRIRPFLALESARLFDIAESCSLRVAAAIEMAHCYSLAHDDLPAMDDDDLRRGKPSLHRAFDEATAILAGDALLTRAFEVIVDPPTHGDPGVRAALALEFARALGAEGMVGGQMIDLATEGRVDLDIGAITRLQRLKTGALILFACEAGATMAHAGPHLREALRGYAQDLGLAFQMADDLLDVESSVAETGKAVGKDAARGKANFVSLLGAERARTQARLLAAQAAEHLAPFGARADRLRAIARWVVERRA